MRLLSMHKTTPKDESGAPPDEALVSGMGKLMADMGKAGVLLGAEGLHATARGVRLKFKRGRHTVTRGPYKGGNELVAGYCQLQTRSIDDAIRWAVRLAAIRGDTEIDIRPMVEPWDLGFGAKPAGLETTRFMALRKADPDSEAGTTPTAEQRAAEARLLAEMKAAGVLIAAEWLQPSAHGLRLNFLGGKRVVTDGPFAESKELIGGYCMLQVATNEEAIEWATRFAQVFGDVEIDLRPLDEAAAGSVS